MKSDDFIVKQDCGQRHSASSARLLTRSKIKDLFIQFAAALVEWLK